MTTKDRVASRPADAKVTGTWAHLHARRVAYAVKEGPLHVDGAAGPAGEGARGVSFSDDGAHIAYYLKRGAAGHFVRDSEDRGAFAGFGMLPPVWSSDAHAAFTARKVDANTNKAEWWIVVDGEARFGPFSDDQPGFGFGKSKLVWSPKGLAYVAVEGDAMRMCVDGVTLGEAFTIVRDPVFFAAPNGEAKHAYRARRDDKWWLVSTSHVHGPFDACDEPLFAPDGRLFFVAGDDERARVYVDGVVVEDHPKVHDIAVCAGGHALIVGDGTTRQVVHRGWRSDAYANLLGLDVTPDGAHTSVVADEGGKEHIVVNGVVVASAACIPHGATTLSSEGAHVAFLAKGTPSFVHVDDDVHSEPFDNLWSDIVFAPDGKSVMFMAEQGDDMHAFTLDAGAAKARTRPASSAPIEATTAPIEAPITAPLQEASSAPIEQAGIEAHSEGAPGLVAERDASPPVEALPAAKSTSKAAKNDDASEAPKPAKKAAPKKAAASKSKSDDDDARPAKKKAATKAKR